MKKRVRRRGLALITVLILLSVCLFFVTAILIRSNNSIFMVDTQLQSTRARYIAESAAIERGVLIRQSYEKFAKDAAASVNDALPNGVNIMSCSNYAYTITDKPVYGAVQSATPIGYANVTIQYVPRTAPKADVIITSTGSILPSSMGGRLTRTIRLTYHLDAPPASIFNFAYFMNHWAWWSGYSQGQVQIFGNTGANANFDVLSGSVAINNANMPPVNVFGTLYNNNTNPAANNNSPFAALNVRANITGQQTASGFGNITGNVSPVSGLGRMPTLTNLSDIADDTGAIISKATTEAAQSNSRLEIRSYDVLSTSPFTLSPTYTVKTTFTTSGVYPPNTSLKENLVLAGTPTNQMVSGYNRNINPSTGRPRVDVISVTGPVVVKGNVVMQGLVEGRGTLFAGRNLYIAGNVQYKGGASPTAAPAYDFPTNGQTANGTSTSPTPLPTPSQSDCQTASMVSYVAGGNVIYGNVTSGSWQSNVMSWLNYIDPSTNQRVNDNHEDAGMDGIVNSKQYFPSDSKEDDSKWTVQVVDGSGNKTWRDFTVINGSVDTSGYTVVKGTGEDHDGNGRYTPAFTYSRDLNFASRIASDGSWTPQSFSTTFFDQMPTNTGNSSTNYTPTYNGTYATFCTPINRIDGYVVSNNAIAGWLGNMSGSNTQNVVCFGGQIGRQECMITNLGSCKQLLYQDPRLKQTAVPINDQSTDFLPQNTVESTEWLEL